MRRRSGGGTSVNIGVMPQINVAVGLNLAVLSRDVTQLNVFEQLNLGDIRQR